MEFLKIMPCSSSTICQRETRWAEAAERYRQAFGQLRSQLQALDPTLAVNDERMLAC